MPTYTKYAIRIVDNWSLITHYEGLSISLISSLYWYNSETNEKFYTKRDLPDGWAIKDPDYTSIKDFKYYKVYKYINVFSKEETDNINKIPGYVEKQELLTNLDEISIDKDKYKLLSYAQGIIIMGMGWLIKTYIENDLRCLDMRPQYV